MAAIPAILLLATGPVARPTAWATAGPALCGDLDASGQRVASDALLLLRSVVGHQESLQCPGCPSDTPLCGDLDDSGAVVATDALLLLQAAVGLVTELACPLCTPTSTTTTTTMPAGACSPLPVGDTHPCSVVAGSQGLLVRATILTADEAITDGSVAVAADGRIACVGCDCAAALPDPTVITCPGVVVSPGLINLHDHVTFSHNAPLADSGERWEHRHDWRLGLDGHSKLSYPGGASADQLRLDELRELMVGVTSIAGSGSVAGWLRNLDSTTLDEGLDQGRVQISTFPLGDSSGTRRSADCAYPSIVSPATVAGTDAYLAHVGAGIDEFAANELRCISGTAEDGVDLLLAPTALVDPTAATAADYARMAAGGASIVWTARASLRVYGDVGPIAAAARLGVPIALGTDVPAVGSMNLARELRCADDFNRDYLDGFFSDQDLWRIVTTDAARVAAIDDAVGSIAAGQVADLALFDGAGAATPWRAVLDARPQDVVLVLRAGKPLYGDATLVGALAADCDPLSVCGSAKRVCASDEMGRTYATLEAAVAADYPAFFCDMPEDEPSCIPARSQSVDGSTVYSGERTEADADGDGIVDDLDDCPTVFNPVRPLDAGEQADSDADGLGDACDPQPLTAP